MNTRMHTSSPSQVEEFSEDRRYRLQPWHHKFRSKEGGSWSCVCCSKKQSVLLLPSTDPGTQQPESQHHERPGVPVQGSAVTQDSTVLTHLSLFPGFTARSLRPHFLWVTWLSPGEHIKPWDQESTCMLGKWGM